MKIINYLFILILSLFFISPMANGISPESIEIRRIDPPKLELKNIKKKIISYRPMRKGSPAMFLERNNAQIIVHNYGHGGSGLTLAPGAAKYVIDLLEKELGTQDKDKSIIVLGAGVIGLFTALELQERGYANISIIAENFEDLTSHHAGGLLAPASMDNDPKIQPLIDQIGIDAYSFYKQVALGKNPLLKSGAKLMTTYFGTRETSTLEPYVKANIMLPAKDVLLDFGNGAKRKMIAYDDGIFIDSDVLMVALREALHNTVKFKRAIIKNISEIKGSIIINCTGLGAKQLMHDPQMVAVQGHLILLTEQNAESINYMLSVYVEGGETAAGYKVKRKCSLFPKKELGGSKSEIGVIGGTFIEGANDSVPNVEQFEIEWANARKFFGISKENKEFSYN